MLALTSSQWDIADPRRAGEIVQAGDVVINCAAYTAVDDAERDQDRAHADQRRRPRTHRHGPARGSGPSWSTSPPTTSSTVTFGDAAPRPYEPQDASRPLSVYGQTKLSGEQAVLAALPQAVVVRTAWVYTGGKR